MRQGGKLRIKSEEQGALHLKRLKIFSIDRERFLDALTGGEFPWIEVKNCWKGGKVEESVSLKIVPWTWVIRDNDRGHVIGAEIIVRGIPDHI